MKLKKLIAGTLLATTAVCSYSLSTPSKIYLFGDSLSDAGYQNILPLEIDLIALVDPDVPAWPTGKLPTYTTYDNSNPADPKPGYVYGQLLLDAYGLMPLIDSALSQSTNNTTKITGTEIPGLDNTLENFGVSGTTNGPIYAAGGATTTGAGIFISEDVPEIPGILPAGDYLIYYPPSTEIQVNTFLSANNPAEQANTVYIMWAGANNIFKAQEAGTSDSGMLLVAENAVSDIMTQIELLINAGAKHIVLLNLPDLGDTPASLKQGIVASAAATELSIFFNNTLSSSLTVNGFNNEVIIVDVFSEMTFMVENQQTSPNITINGKPLYFSNVTDPACGEIAFEGGLQGSALMCVPEPGTVSSVNYSTGDFTSWTTSGGGDYLFTDDVHPSAEAHKGIQILVKNTIDNGWEPGDNESSGFNSFWDFMLKIITLGIAGN